MAAFYGRTRGRKTPRLILGYVGEIVAGTVRGWYVAVGGNGVGRTLSDFWQE